MGVMIYFMENLYRDKTMIGEKRSSHIHGINGLKGIAIIGVTLFHMFPETVRGGYLGVVLFLGQCKMLWDTLT